MFAEILLFRTHWDLDILTSTLDDTDFARADGMRLSLEPKPLPISYCSESETHPHAVTFTFCRMVTKVIPPKTSSLFGMACISQTKVMVRHWWRCFQSGSDVSSLAPAETTMFVTQKPGKKGSFRSFVQTSFCLVHLKGDSALKTQV